jgi:O-acetylhomoserine (thiol)-lyase
MSALFVTVLALCSAGDHIVSSSQMYGANINLFEHTLKRYGIETSFVAPNDPEAISGAIRPNTKMVFGEVIGNPGMDIMDVPAVAKITQAAGIPLVIDATFNTPLDGQTDRIGRKCGDPFAHQMDGRPWHRLGRCSD